MSWTAIAPGQWKSIEPLGEGVASIGKDGSVTVRTEDLAMANIDESGVVVMFEADRFRIGLRRAHAGEEGLRVRVCVIRKGGKKGGDSGRRRINISRAIAALGLKPDAVCGRYDLSTQGGNDAGGSELLILTVMPDTNPKPKPKK